MIITLILNPQTLEVTLDDSEAVINEVKTLEDGNIFIELSLPDSEVMDLYTTNMSSDSVEPTDPTGQ